MTDDLKGKPTVYRFDLLKDLELPFDHVLEYRYNPKLSKHQWTWFDSGTIFGKFDTLEEAIAAIKGTS